MAGIRSGRVFIDLTASKDRLLDFSARGTTGRVEMGDVLQASAGEQLELAAHVAGCQGSRLRMLVDGREGSPIPAMPIASSDQTLTASWRSDGRRHWIRADVVSDSGKLQVLGNPVYVNFP
jgi:hypothetical protein